MSKEYYKKKIIDLRAKLQKEKDAKKKDNERYADYIKRATTTDRKAYYRKERCPTPPLTTVRLNPSNEKSYAQKRH